VTAIPFSIFVRMSMFKDYEQL